VTVGPVVFTRPGMLRGVRAALPIMLGTLPFALVTGIASQGAGLSMAEALLMSASVFGGAAQLLVLGSWTVPASVLAATLAAFTVNLRLVLMGPVLAPWLDRIAGWRRWGTLFFLVDQNWGLALKEMNAGGRDLGFMFGAGVVMWLQWIALTGVGFALGSVLKVPPGHPIFFSSLAVFVCMLAGMWRSRADLLPWAVAIAVAVATAKLFPGSFYYIVAGAIAGSLAGAVRDQVRR
jgi:predicted branched-subunit amino acid permease